MPRPGPARKGVNVKLADEGHAWLEGEALRLGVTKSEVIRAALARWAALPPGQRTIPKP